MTAQPKPPRFTDSLANLVGEPVADIREKLVEEAWFGRPTAPRSGFDDMIRSVYGEPVERAPMRENPNPAPDMEIDR